jgi:hypothetical protein
MGYKLGWVIVTITRITFSDSYPAWRIDVGISEDEDFKIGYMKGVLIPEYSSDNHKYANKIADDEHQDAIDVCKDFNPKCLSEPDMVMRLVIIMKAEISEEFRGKDHSINAMNDVIKFFSSMPGTVIILQPHPYAEDNPQGIKKLQKHWMKCGFKRCGRTSCFFRECDLL